MELQIRLDYVSRSVAFIGTWVFWIRLSPWIFAVRMLGCEFGVEIAKTHMRVKNV